MPKKIVPCILVVMLFSACGNSDVPPWLRDANEGADTGRDAAGDIVTPHDAIHETLDGVARDAGWDALADQGTEVVGDTGTDTHPVDAHEVLDTHADVPIDTGADAADSVEDVPPDTTTDTANDTAADTGRDTSVDTGTDTGADVWECERDDECQAPADLGICEQMKCRLHKCAREDRPDQETCNDSSMCTTGDHCVGGACIGTPVICDDGNVCTNDYCNPNTGCTTSAKNNFPCEDGDPCTVNDRCNAKVCRSGSQMSCITPPGASCNDDGSGVLSFTGPGYCSGGECVYQSTTTPCPQGCANNECVSNPCYGVECKTPPGPCYKSTGTCSLGDCTYQFDNTAACTDNDPCTTDTCNQGTCKSLAKACNTPPAKFCDNDGVTLVVYASVGYCSNGDCQYDESTITCANGCANNACVNDPCAGVDCTVGAGPCQKTPGVCVNGECIFEDDDTATCSDGNECTDGDHCSGGTCVPGAAVACDDDNACTNDYCDEATGCVYEDVSAGCNDDNPCTDDFCSMLTGCWSDPNDSNTCTDDNKCTVGDTCTDGTCVPGATDTCNDNNVCTDDSCNPATGCSNTANTIQCRPATCDGLVFKPAAYCSQKTCQYPSDQNCDDGEFCTNDTCDTTLGCQKSFSTASCDDGNVCTTGDACQGGSCHGTPKACMTPPSDYCFDPSTVVRYDTTGFCREDGTCDYAKTSWTCEHGCVDGVCAGDPCEGVDCTTPPSSCYVGPGVCSAGQCVFGFSNGTVCDSDASVCTIESCHSGACTLDSNRNCDFGNPCLDYSCDATLGCVDEPNTAACNDNNACTTGDVCSGGTCNGTPMTCDDSDVCTTDSCTNGTCQYVAISGCCTTDAMCNDNDICTQDTCNTVARTCGHSAIENCCHNLGDCNDGNPCNLDYCESNRCVYSSDNVPYCCYAPETTNPDTGLPWASPEERTAFADAQCAEGSECFPEHYCDLSLNMCNVRGEKIEGCCTNDSECQQTAACVANEACVDNKCTWDLTTPDCCVTAEDCDDQPTDTCDGDTAVQYAAGTCDSNACNYHETRTPCEFGCLLGECQPDPCAGVNCNTPPGICYKGTGTCDGGTCQYDYDNGKPCDLDSSVCTPDQCNSGYCEAGWPIDCNDGVDCTTDGCNPVSGCYNTPNNAACPDDGNECTTVKCDADEGCVTSFTSQACNDGNACTEDDTCTNGACVGDPKYCGTDTTCTDFWCDPAIGCRETWLEGTCDDGDLCTIQDQCIFGTCGAAGTMNCNDGNSCTTDSCKNGVCSHVKAANLTPCDDGNPCTTDDKCYNGYCSGNGLNCDDEDQCTTDSCNLDTMECIYSFNSNACDDNNKCTTNDQCTLGACTGAAVNCNDNNPCTDDSCNPSTGCVHTNNTASCEDGNACTVNDVCSAGACTAGTTRVCDDGNECTSNVCDTAAGCVYNAVSGSCNDGDPCTYGDYCSNKECHGVAITCEPALACTTAECDGTDRCAEGIEPGWCVINGQCVAENATPSGNPCRYCNPALNPTGWSDNTVSCNDGNSCTSGDTCANGTCSGQSYGCNDNLACTLDSCDGVGGCGHTPIAGWCVIGGQCYADGTTNPSSQCKMCSSGLDATDWSNRTGTCEDGNECTVGDTCSAGVCTAGTARTCDDGNPCTSNMCDSGLSGGCYYPTVLAICAASRCEGLVYYAAAMCSGNTCPAQTSTNCDDGNPCTDDQCTTTGCKHTINSASCSDGNPCTSGDHCVNTVCSGNAYTCSPSSECILSSVCNGDGGCTETPKGSNVACSDDGNPCTADKCDGNGTCGHTDLGDGTSCDDNNACTTGGTCLGGQCSDGNDVTCEPLDQCHVAGECDPQTGLCSNPAANDGTPCDDGNPCTLDDVCSQGVCVGPTVNPCTPLDGCHGAGSCNPTTGACTYPTLADGTGCDDNNLCTTRDVCSKGVCKGLNPISCTPQDTCHYTGTCAPETGLCTWPKKPDGTTCDDGNACTTGTQCSDGTCGGGTAKTCPAINNCHYDGVCAPSTGVCSAPVKDDGTLCSDSNACSSGDHCVSGTCTGSTYSCSDGRSCTTDTCNGDGTCSYPVNTGWCLIDGYCRAEGATNPSNSCQVCFHDALATAWSSNQGALCNDYRLDTKDDQCVGTVCTGTPYDCGDGLDCTEDICDGNGGATHNLLSGYCLIDGACWTSNSVNPANACQKCSVSSSTTAWTPTANGQSCDDSQPCTYNDKCQSGICEGTTYSCDDGLACTNNWCTGGGNCGGSVVAGWCVIWNACVANLEMNPTNDCQQCDAILSPTGWSPANEGVACDDNNPNTTGDKCVDGNCIGEGLSCVDGLECTEDLAVGGECQHPLIAGWCLIDGQCIYDNNVNNSNRCQICHATANATGWSANDGVVCSDNDSCTSDDVCANQVCTGTRMQCNDNIACTADACVAGNCEFTISEGWCLIDGACVIADSVNPSNGCEKCDPAVLNVNWSSNEGASCDDSDTCTHDDQCVSKVCRGTGYSCNDGIACTADACDGNGGCNRTVNAGWCLIDGNCIAEDATNTYNVCLVCDHAVNDHGWSDNAGAQCNDGNLCTWPDTCSLGQCGGVPKACDDHLACTTDFCDGTGGCLTPVLNGGWCLIDGQCRANRAVNPDNPCEICKPEASTATWSFRDGVPCDDSNDCTVFDTCGEGVCSGTTYSCDDGLSCTTDVCDGTGGCDSTGIATDKCLIAGACRTASDESPADPCQGCNPGADQTAWTVLAGNDCSDGNDCTIGDVCDASGQCSGVNHPCDDGVACTDNVCDGAGGCQYPISDGWCRINGDCVADGTKHPTELCMVCAPTINQTTWTTQDPGVDDVCNGADDNCDGVTDPENAPGCRNYYVDADHDGVGAGTAFRCLCAPDGNYRSLENTDCDDSNAAKFPGNDEICDHMDNDCDGVTDGQNSVGCHLYYYDYDRDGFGQSGTQRCLCEPDGYYDADLDADCNDASISVNPAATEVCDGVDNDCDGVADPDGTTGCMVMYKDEDGDLWGAEPAICMCVPRGVYTLTTDGDCDDTDTTISPNGTEICNLKDDDCDGTTDNADVTAVCPLDTGFEAHATRTCSEGECALICDGPGVSPPWHDTDGYFGNGCECEGDGYDGSSGESCSNATDLGVFSDSGTSATIVGNLPEDDAVDWYRVTFEDTTWDAEPGNTDLFHARIKLDPFSAEEYELAIFTDCSSTPLCGLVSTYEWAVDFTSTELGENPCGLRGNNCPDGNPTDYAECLAVTGDAQKCNSCPALPSAGLQVCSDNTRTVLVRVRRHDGLSRSCASYTISISNGS